MRVRYWITPEAGRAWPKPHACWHPWPTEAGHVYPEAQAHWLARQLAKNHHGWALVTTDTGETVLARYEWDAKRRDVVLRTPG